jgi:hypothetical protein
VLGSGAKRRQIPRHPVREDPLSNQDEKKLAALIRKNAAKAEKAKQVGRKQFDKTLPPRTEEDDERDRFFSEMKKREF